MRQVLLLRHLWMSVKLQPEPFLWFLLKGMSNMRKYLNFIQINMIQAFRSARFMGQYCTNRNVIWFYGMLPNLSQNFRDLFCSEISLRIWKKECTSFVHHIKRSRKYVNSIQAGTEKVLTQFFQVSNDLMKFSISTSTLKARRPWLSSPLWQIAFIDASLPNSKSTFRRSTVYRFYYDRRKKLKRMYPIVFFSTSKSKTSFLWIVFRKFFFSFLKITNL